MRTETCHVDNLRELIEISNTIPKINVGFVHSEEKDFKIVYLTLDFGFSFPADMKLSINPLGHVFYKRIKTDYSYPNSDLVEESNIEFKKLKAMLEDIHTKNVGSPRAITNFSQKITEGL